MRSPRRPEPADPDFDPAPIASARLRGFEPLEHQRVVVNPFLAVLGLLLWWESARWLLFRGPFPPMAIVSVLALIGLPWTIQYHCLDCGRTGVYPRRYRHACSGVVARWLDRRTSGFRVPSARKQLVIWAYLVGAALLLAALADSPRQP